MIPETADSIPVRQALAGDQNAFKALVNRYQHSLFWLIYHYVGDHYEAQDILQQVWYQLYSLAVDSRSVSSARLSRTNLHEATLTLGNGMKLT